MHDIFIRPVSQSVVCITDHVQVHSVTLVFQQATVLECNLDHKVISLCGAMGCDLWTASVWQKHFSANEVIVCTADILLMCLSHSFLRMDQINLLIFDEAHHAKKGHPYARIMRDFYITELEKSKRPRVFGMTASPVDAKVDVIQAAKELEELLHSRIATTTSGSLVALQSRLASEMLLVYPRLPEPFDTPLFQQMRSRFDKITSQNFQQLFKDSRQASSELGAWASDKFWEFALADKQQVRKAEMSIERVHHKNKENRSVCDKPQAWKLLVLFSNLKCHLSDISTENLPGYFICDMCADLRYVQLCFRSV